MQAGTARSARAVVVRLLLCVLTLQTVAPAFSQPSARIDDDFRRYRTLADLERRWDLDSGFWSAEGGALHCDGTGAALALPHSAPHGARLLVEATIVPRRATGTDWKTAGIGIQRDDGNYWRLSLVEQPESLGRGHFFELNEAVDGRWLANSEGDTRLQQSVSESAGGSWQFDHPYRLRLELSSEGIVGAVSELDGTVRWRLGFLFSARACTVGRPALAASNLAADYRDFRAEVLQKAPAPPAPSYPAYVDPSPGPGRGKATGFFHVERIGGRWWVVDPNGRTFYAVGTDHANFNAHFCEKLGYAPYHRNALARHGSEAAWARSTLERLKAWGFNTLGAGCSESLRHQGLAHTVFLSLGAGFTSISDIAPRTTWTGFPDVFHPRFQTWCDQQARRMCRPNRTDPWLFGYFLDNELEWFGKNGSETGLVDEAFKKPADHPAKQALVAFLRRKYPSIEALCRAWGIRAGSWAALAQATEPPPARTPAAREDRIAFVRLIAERYFAVTTSAVRKADPNHMVIGCRFAGFAPPVWDIAGKFLDIVSVNYYGQVDLQRGVTTDMPAAMRRYAASAGRPLMLTEWSFPALDAGLPCRYGAGQRVATQKDKARAYAIYQKALFGLPFMVGSDYFMWVDEPAQGISSTFPEDSNYGLVDVNDDPWPDLTRTAARINRLACALHAGSTAELSGSVVERPGRAPVLRVRNAGRVSADAEVRIWVQNVPATRRVQVAPGGARDVPLVVPGGGPALVVAEIDPDERLVETDRSDNRVEAVVGKGRVHGLAALVVNPSDRELSAVPVVLPIPAALQGASFGVRAGGSALPAQVDDLPEGRKLAVRIPELPARSVTVLRLAPGGSIASAVERGPDRDIRLTGALDLVHRAGSANLLDSVSLEGVPLGSFRALVHQTGVQSLWIPPDQIDAITRISGPVRSVLVFDASLRSPGASGARTAAGPGATYAARQSAAGRFQLTWEITQTPGEAWFGSRFLAVRNSDTRPWRLQSYYHYPLSSIAGSAADDQPAGASGTPLWHDAAARATYGAVADTRDLKSTFWKDTPDGSGEHADIWKEIGRELKPGEAVRAGAHDPEVLVFGAVRDEKGDGGATLVRVRALQSLRCAWIQGGAPQGETQKSGRPRARPNAARRGASL